MPTNMPDSKSRIDRSLPWLIVLATVVAVLAAALAQRTPHLPGIALESRPLFLIERATTGVIALILLVTLVTRGLKGDLPTGFSTAAGAIKYAETVEAATTSSDATAAELAEELAEERSELAALNTTVDRLANSVAEIRAVVLPELPQDPPVT
jgi:hypothetical protein